MKTLIPFLLLFSFNALGEHSPIKHSIDPTCQYQLAQTIIAETTARYGATHRVLTPGLYIDIYA